MSKGNQEQMALEARKKEEREVQNTQILKSGGTGCKVKS